MIEQKPKKTEKQVAEQLGYLLYKAQGEWDPLYQYGTNRLIITNYDQEFWVIVTERKVDSP